MIGDKYREIGSRRVIYVMPEPSDAQERKWRVWQGDRLYGGRVGEKFVSEMSWRNEAEAQSYLDRLAKVRGWKLVKKK